jgi:hypothetical protein
VPTFDFIVADDLLRTTFDIFLSNRDDISREIVIDVLYIEQQSPPKPKKNVNHEDWVAGVSALDDLIVSGCYDNTVTIWCQRYKAFLRRYLLHVLSLNTRLVWKHSPGTNTLAYCQSNKYVINTPVGHKLV